MCFFNLEGWAVLLSFQFLNENTTKGAFQNQEGQLPNPPPLWIPFVKHT